MAQWMQRETFPSIVFSVQRNGSVTMVLSDRSPRIPDDIATILPCQSDNKIRGQLSFCMTNSPMLNFAAERCLWVTRLPPVCCDLIGNTLSSNTFQLLSSESDVSRLYHQFLIASFWDIFNKFSYRTLLWCIRRFLLQGKLSTNPFTILS